MKIQQSTPISKIELPERLNLCSYLLDARITEGHGARVAIRTATSILNFSEVKILSENYTRILARDNIKPKERVIVALPDTPDFVGALFGVLRLGSIVVLVNPDAPKDLLSYFFDYVQPTAAFVPANRFELFRVATYRCARLPKLYGVGNSAFSSTLDMATGDISCFDSYRDDPALLSFSGGTTGRPKGVMQAHRSFATTTHLYGQNVLNINKQDITISVPKLYFGYATGSNLFFPFSVGASCVLFPERCTPAKIFDQIRRHRPTVFVGVPNMIQQMVSHDEAALQDLSCLRLATSAGEALPFKLHKRWLSTFNVELLDGLGSSEMSHIFLSNRSGAVAPGTLGKVVPGFDIKLCDDKGIEVVDNEIGRLWVRGESRAIGYWQQAKETVQAFQGEWYVSGDMLRLRSDGNYVYCGRVDSMLKINGKWLAPPELENCLLTHPAVREVAVVGVINDTGLVKPWAFIVADTPSAELESELQAFTKTRLESYKYPRKVVFLKSLPRTHLGKVDRGSLARQT